MNNTTNSLREKYPYLFDKTSVMYIWNGDDFDRLVFAKGYNNSDLHLYCVDRLEVAGHDSRFTKFTGTLHDHDDFNDEDVEEHVQIYVDRSNDYKVKMFYGHEGWLV